MLRFFLYSFVCLSLLTFNSSFSDPQDIYRPSNEWPVVIADGWFSAKTYTIGKYQASSKTNGSNRTSIFRTFPSAKNVFHYQLTSNASEYLITYGTVASISIDEKTLPKYLHSKHTGNADFFYAELIDQKDTSRPHWEMIIRKPHYLSLNKNNITGTLRSGNRSFMISAHNKFSFTNSYEKTCYEFKSKKKILAAVMLDKQPKVWVEEGLDSYESQVFAAAVSSLLQQ
ncbi:hypothetical protein COR50_04675 [Chitinophaga caeni]|uniref:Uncharacterized protein n=1 Tax=Chitinophaga caeni TaxID=2029983 RepID=A0A291QRH4_9BACT|nr:hypothetical protein [Chitinophaga caeni]ATL46526.1 hypothetical protein COR50_04675 [Chitinophaga caeni]